MSNIININKPTLEQQLAMITHNLLVLGNFQVQIITAIEHFNGYDFMEEDFKGIEKVIKENNIKLLDLKNLPECISSKFSESQIVLYSMSVLKNLLLTDPGRNIVQSDKFINGKIN